MKRYFWLIPVIIFSLSGVVICQSNLPLGRWKSHLSYKEGKRLTQNADKVIYASEKGIFTISKDDISLNFLSKEDGLSDVNVNQLHYDKVSKQLIIIYSDNTIDIIKNDVIINIPFIKTNTTVQGSKTINDMFIADTGESFFATDFGILGFDLKKLEFPFTTFTELKVLSVAMLGGTLYAGTEEGLYTIALKGTNISDFNIWKSIASDKGLPQSFDVKSLAVKFNSLFALIDNKIYRMDANGNFSIVYSPVDRSHVITYISDDGSDLMVGVEKENNSRTI